jgi:hypothetical protein
MLRIIRQNLLDHTAPDQIARAVEPLIQQLAPHHTAQDIAAAVGQELGPQHSIQSIAEAVENRLAQQHSLNAIAGAVEGRLAQAMAPLAEAAIQIAHSLHHLRTTEARRIRDPTTNRRIDMVVQAHPEPEGYAREADISTLVEEMEFAGWDVDGDMDVDTREEGEAGREGGEGGQGVLGGWFDFLSVRLRRMVEC